MTTDYARLRALAEAVLKAESADEGWYEAELLRWSGVASRDADFLAAIDPPTLIALLDELERLRREPEWEYAVIAGQTTLPARFDDLIEAERHARAWSASAEVLRRRKAGEWGPVTGDDDAHDA